MEEHKCKDVDGERVPPVRGLAGKSDSGAEVQCWAPGTLSTPAHSLGQSGKIWGGSISVLILLSTLDFNKPPLCAALL